MNHEIDLSKYGIRTDLAIELLNENTGIEGIVCAKSSYEKVNITDVEVNPLGSKAIGKKPGLYITIEFEDVTDKNNQNQVLEVFQIKLKEMLQKLNIEAEDSCLVIGLGNDRSTPDSLGPLSIDNILVTNHLFELGELSSDFRRVSAINPGVMGTTGIETSDIIVSVVKKIKPDFVIVIDALASQSVERVNKTIQMTDTGIHPGSGVGNSRKEISREVLGVPVIAIGVPTTVDAVTIVSDTINYMYKHFSYTKDNINNPSHKLMVSTPNYLKKSFKVDKEDKHKLLGMIGDLNEQEIRQLIFEVLTPVGYNLMVTPKEIDFLIDKLSYIIGEGINMSLHNNLDDFC
ncbi:MAG: GPR endopeptidase [Firmicutes bacterium]|nr:GPR endopeptidase [Bacillota bacterium]